MQVMDTRPRHGKQLASRSRRKHVAIHGANCHNQIATNQCGTTMFSGQPAIGMSHILGPDSHAPENAMEKVTRLQTAENRNRYNRQTQSKAVTRPTPTTGFADCVGHADCDDRDVSQPPPSLPTTRHGPEGSNSSRPIQPAKPAIGPAPLAVVARERGLLPRPIPPKMPVPGGVNGPCESYRR